MTPLSNLLSARPRTQTHGLPRLSAIRTALSPAAASDISEIFVGLVSRLNAVAIQIHRTATLRSQCPDIRAYARHMADSHVWLNEALLTALEKAGSALTPDYVPSPEQQKDIDALQLIEADRFDIDYIQFQNRLYLDMLGLCERFLRAKAGMANLNIYALTLCDYLRYHLAQFAPTLPARRASAA
ncbi:DUF4142 domain-containing protein [Asticcacaulis sp. AND118]|uniref:DUF4142 domain-containing protein n=1 Tax=Asticcacaulis sp. AND118 TaxID=2840468 RepID=UPI001CFFEE98|nr:DUF4142 domain-containing protein [Asticcacaulis sp. AND118]UDF04667.1 DUF4142 domain-containing protein [Asticcacaulis sp. AND118]